MARITVEDCLGKLGNRFELVIAASRRARLIATGAVEPLVPLCGDKPTVVALREIAAGLIDGNGDPVNQEVEEPLESSSDEAEGHATAQAEEPATNEGTSAV